MTSALKVAKNIQRRYGDEKLNKLLTAFKNGESCADIAKDFSVSRQRIHQWKQDLGTEKVYYYVHTEVEALIGSQAARKTI